MSRTKAADEVFCKSCGQPMRKRAEICPECGVRNTIGTIGSGTPTDDAETDDAPSSSSYLSAVIAWGGGIFLLLAGLGAFTYSSEQPLRAILGGGIVVSTGLFCLPPVRDLLEEQLNLALSRGLVIVIAFVGLFLGVGIGPN